MIKKKLNEIKELSIKLGAMPLKEEKINLLFNLLDKFLNKEIFYLEIGSGIGWSFLNFALRLNIKEAILIEKDKEKAQILSKNLLLLNELNKRISVKIINKDALEFLQQEQKKKSIIRNKENLLKLAFVDANKSKYLDYYLLLKESCDIIIFDNSFFHLKVQNNKKYKTLNKKLQEFHNFLLNEDEKIIIHLKVYDGLTIVTNKNLIEI